MKKRIIGIAAISALLTVAESAQTASNCGKATTKSKGKKHLRDP